MAGAHLALALESFIHSGGHAWPEDLERLAKALQPRALEIVHTARA